MYGTSVTTYGGEIVPSKTQKMRRKLSSCYNYILHQADAGGSSVEVSNTIIQLYR